MMLHLLIVHVDAGIDLLAISILILALMASVNAVLMMPAIFSRNHVFDDLVKTTLES